MRTITRLSLGVALAAATAFTALAASVSPSFVSLPSGNVKPTLTATQASFVIPSSPSGTWTLKLWTLPAPSHIVGRTEGTSGTVTLPVPQTSNCEFQVDVRFSADGTTSQFYSGLIATVPGCGQSGNGTRLTPGYWKTHQSATQALLPQNLGSYVVSTASQATAIFTDMNCSDAIDCLTGHLLAAELDVANDSSICITGVIFDANHFLTKVGYNGPASYTINSTQRARALALEVAVDNYTNDSTSTSC